MTPAGLLLTHGAGGDRDHRLFVAMEAEFDLPVKRMNFPYRAAGRRGPPDRAPKLIEALLDEVERFTTELGVAADRVVLGGRSMGGRICSMAVAEGLGAAGLVLLSYPLHPVGRPERLRVDHFGDIVVPTLFVNGDRDPFGTPEEVGLEIPAISGPVDVHWLAGQRHDPRPAFDVEIIEVVGHFINGL